VCAVLSFMGIAGWGWADGLIRNPGFEDATDTGLPNQWSGPASVYSREVAFKRSGSASLKYVNDNAEVYALCTQPVPLQTGKRYRISAWVKTQDIKGEESGATICAEWQDAQGKWLGGHYPEGAKGTTDWTHIESVTPRIPADAHNYTFTCYVRRAMTGTAWWDDVAITYEPEPPFSSVLTAPDYRGQVAGANPELVRVRCLINLIDCPVQLGDACLAWRVLENGDRSVVMKGEVYPIPAATADVTVDARELPAGKYIVEITFQRKDNGEVLATNTWLAGAGFEPATFGL